jgi:uncharacterized protein YcbX
MRARIGVVSALFRYPVKSMAGESMESATLGWQGLEGDRRFAFGRTGDASGFPWLTAGKLPSLVLYRPFRSDQAPGSAPDFVKTPAGASLPLQSEELQRELSERLGVEMRLMHLRHGIFDEAPLSLITLATIAAIEQASEMALDIRRFRPNVLIDTGAPAAFVENDWVGGVVSFGERPDAPSAGVTLKDVRCGMLNIDPDTAALNPAVLRAAVRSNDNCAGAYGVPLTTGLVSIGDPVYLTKSEE